MKSAVSVFVRQSMAIYTFVIKSALKTAEMSGKRAKTGHFPYIKQNSIAEIVSTMESFLSVGYKKDIFALLR